MTGVGILLEHEIEGRVESFRRNLPGDQRAGSEVCGEQGLAHAPDCSGFKHPANPAEDDVQRQPSLPGDAGKGIADEARNLIL
jgi:hypothetical protein